MLEAFSYRNNIPKLANSRMRARARFVNHFSSLKTRSSSFLTSQPTKKVATAITIAGRWGNGCMKVAMRTPTTPPSRIDTPEILISDFLRSGAVDSRCSDDEVLMVSSLGRVIRRKSTPPAQHVFENCRGDGEADLGAA